MYDQNAVNFKWRATLLLTSVNSRRNFAILAMKTSLEAALKDPKRGPSVRESIFAEIENLDKPGVVKPIKRKNIPKELQKDTIGMHIT